MTTTAGTMMVWYLLIDHENKALGNSDSVSVSHNTTVAALKKEIKKDRPDIDQTANRKVAAAELTVWRCTERDVGKGSSFDLEEKIKSLKIFKTSGHVERVDPEKTVGALGLDPSEKLLVQVPSKTTKSAGKSRSAFQAEKYELASKGKPLFLQQKNIYRVQRIGDASKTGYIAKRLRTDSEELEILQTLSMAEPRCEYIIQLVDTIESSVGMCIVLPELGCVADELFLRPNGGVLRGQFIELSRDLAKAITFLHDHGIAHLDIKPANMLFTNDKRLRMIDFDTSVWVEDENEEIEGFIGSEDWMAPEIGSRDGPNFCYSPIRADRFSCGRVFKAFLAVHEGNDEGLGEFTTKLLNNDPHKRPQLREWCKPAARSKDAEDETVVSEGETLVAEEDNLRMANSESSKRPLKRCRSGSDDFNVPTQSCHGPVH